jgi:cytochrome c biogenesis protein CcmG, thiol:disulfide interchange protein DsbE
LTIAPKSRLSEHWNARHFAITLSLLLGASALAASPDTLAPGMPAPPFSSPRLDGRTVALESLRGRVVLLNFWAVECPPCRIEMPEIEKIHRRYSGRGLRVLGITEMDPARDQAARFVAEIGVTYPILLDPGARIGALYGIEAHPTSVVIDARGIVRFLNVGYLRGEEKEIERAIREALSAGAGPSGGAHGGKP